MAILLDYMGGVSDNDKVVSWLQTPYGIAINEDPDKAFTNIQSYVKRIQEDSPESNESDVKQSVSKWMAIANHEDNETGGYDISNNVDSNNEDASLIGGKPFFSAPNFTDTRVGGNDAINPYWQFNRDDDITPPMFAIRGKTDDNRFGSSRGMGRVYAETYQANQRILWLQAGVPEYRNIAAILLESGDGSAQQAMTQGSLAGLGTKVFRMLVKGAIWFITFPITAPLFAMRWMATLGTNDVTKFYRFRPAMPLYFDMTNTMLSYLAVSMGLYPQYIIQKSDTHTSYDENTKRYSMKDTSSEKIYDATGKATSLTKDEIQNSSIPEILKNGPDLYVMLNRRAMLFKDAIKDISTREILSSQLTEPNAQIPERTNYLNIIRHRKDTDIVKNKQGVLDRAFGSLKSTMYGTFDFVGFRIERGVSTSESISSTTGPSPIFERLNERGHEKQAEVNSAGNSYATRKILDLINKKGDTDSWLKGIGIDALANQADAVGLNSAASIINSGNGFFEVPEMWQDSRFQKSQSFTVQLRARYGDPVSIYQSIYVPLMMLIGLAAPRSVGDNMYTQPFLVKAYCKGMFSVACGMIDSLDITRGKDEFGWNNQLLPTAVDVRVSIKDQTPVMFLAMQDIGFFDTFSRNEGMMEYLDTLSALSIYDRMYLAPRAARKFATAILVKKNTILSPEWWGVKAGNTGPGNIFSNMNPWMPVAHEGSDIR